MGCRATEGRRRRDHRQDTHADAGVWHHRGEPRLWRLRSARGCDQPDRRVVERLGGRRAGRLRHSGDRKRYRRLDSCSSRVVRPRRLPRLLRRGRLARRCASGRILRHDWLALPRSARPAATGASSIRPAFGRNGIRTAAHRCAVRQHARGLRTSRPRVDRGMERAAPRLGRSRERSPAAILLRGLFNLCTASGKRGCTPAPRLLRRVRACNRRPATLGRFS